MILVKNEQPDKKDKAQNFEETKEESLTEKVMRSLKEGDAKVKKNPDSTTSNRKIIVAKTDATRFSKRIEEKIKAQEKAATESPKLKDGYPHTTRHKKAAGTKKTSEKVATEKALIEKTTETPKIKSEENSSSHRRSQKNNQISATSRKNFSQRLKELAKETEIMSKSQRRKQEKEKENSLVKKIVGILVLVFVLVLIIGGISFWNFWQSGQKPLDTKDSTTELVEIPLGSSNKQIGTILEESNIIKSAVVFNYYMKLNNQSGFQAGFYDLAPNMTLDEIAKTLKEGNTNQKTLLVPEGYTIEQIAADVEKNTPYTKEEFLKAINDQDFFNQLLEKFPELLQSAADATDTRYKLEGYLFPATYTLTPGAKVEGLITQMVQKTQDVLSPYYQEIANKQMTVQQVLTLASLVEKEGVKDDDRRNIAQVFYNRINQGMPLQSDISILYAINEHKELVTIEDTKVDSPYNLYVNQGYGPGPFDSPSENAIKAVLYPQSNDYYYFVADVSTGQVYFARTFDEHEQLVAQYVNK